MVRITKTSFFLSLLFIVITPTTNCFAQEAKKKKVEILHTDILSSANNFQRLLGNVSLKHNETFMYCDSAHYFANDNLVKAYSKVHIQRGDTLHIYGEYLIYDSAIEIAEISDSVTLIDKETTLYTEQVFYDVNAETAYYSKGGKILNGENTLTSIIGKYFAFNEVFHFKENVELVNPDYTMYSDTLNYDTVTDIAYFLGPTEIIGDSLYIHCQRGWYDTENEISMLLDSAKVDNKIQIITGDSLYYENANGYGTGFFNVTITDLDKDVIVKGNKSWYYKEPEQFMVTDSAQFIQINDDDYMFLHADTLWSITNTYIKKLETILLDSIVINEVGIDTLERTITRDTTINYRLLRAFNGCRLYSEDMQAKCDSLAYSFRDSLINLYYEPVLWSEANQLTADSMKLYIKNQELSELKLYKQSFVIENVDSLRFQQVKGKDMIAYFRNNSIHKVEVIGNAENIYYAIDEKKLLGVNQATCAKIVLLLEEGKIQEIRFHTNPDGILDPPLNDDPTEKRLEDFRWLDLIRPKNRWDIFRQPETVLRVEL